MPEIKVSISVLILISLNIIEGSNPLAIQNVV
jgi:hypothetical protein